MNRTEIRSKIILLLKKNKDDDIALIFNENFDKIDLRGLSIENLILNDINLLNMFNNGSFFNKCNFNNVNFFNSDFRGVKFKDTTFNNIKFQNSQIIGAEFVNCTFENIIFSKCDLTGSNFLKNRYKTPLKLELSNMYNTEYQKSYFNNLSSLNILDYYYHKFCMFFKKNNLNLILLLFYLMFRVILNCDIPLHLIELGKNVRFAHLGFNTIIVGHTKIGNNTWIGPNVNIFSRRKTRIKIGKNVVIGIGAKVSADIGDNVIIGAGAIVLDDIPSNSTVYGQKSKIMIMENTD